MINQVDAMNTFYIFDNHANYVIRPRIQICLLQD